MNLLVLTPAQAASVRGGNEDARLEPRLIAAGPQAGMYVLPHSVALDPDHADVAGILAGLPSVDIDPATAWPAIE